MFLFSVDYIIRNMYQSIKVVKDSCKSLFLITNTLESNSILCIVVKKNATKNLSNNTVCDEEKRRLLGLP